MDLKQKIFSAPKRRYITSSLSNFYWYTRHNYAIIMTKKGERYHATYYAY